MSGAMAVTPGILMSADDEDRRDSLTIVDRANVIISGISAAVALADAIVAGVSALCSREAKRIAEERRDEAVAAANKVAWRTRRRRPAWCLCSQKCSVVSAAGEFRTTATSP